MEEDQNSSIEEVAPQDHESNVESQEVAQDSHNDEVESKAPVADEVDDKQERNWREFRRKQREAEAKIAAQNEMIEKLLQAQKTPQPQQVEEPDEFSGLSPEDFPTWGQTDKRIQKQAEAIAERKYRQLREEEEKSRFMERLQSKYTDFNEVVNSDSIALLEEKDPELAATIADLKDPYKIGVQTYKYLKAMNLSQNVSERRHANEVEKKLEKSEKMVQSPQVYNKRPMAQAFQSTEAERAKLYEEMMGYARQVGSGY